MSSGFEAGGEFARLIDHMFEQVLSVEERTELRVWIARWEARNPGVDAAHRVTGWIDVAYEYQARLDGRTAEPAWAFGLAPAL